MTCNISQSTASAPGSLILLGEYAVLSGSKAIILTRLNITLTKLVNLEIYSDRFPAFIESDINVIEPKHVQLIKKIIDRFHYEYNIRQDNSWRINIKSEINCNLGFGSSAALNAALLKALSQFYQLEYDFEKLFNIGYIVFYSFKKLVLGQILQHHCQITQ
ncbi:MAG: hypothetical protein RCG15_00345 [Candidatus Rickettsia vulgarisii]